MHHSVRSLAVTGLTLIGLASLTACDPPVPPAVLTVTTTADSPDASPGDGVCEATPGDGDCTLRAAVAEGNALGSAAITLPAGTYHGSSLVVTGRLSINDGDPVDARLDHWVTIAAGGSLVVDGLSTYGVPGARFVVEGTFVGRHLSLVGLESTGQLVVSPAGIALVENSLFAHVFGNRPTVSNQGRLVLRNTTLRSWSEIGVNTPALANSGTAIVATSILQSCSGTAPVSHGYNSDDDGSCALSTIGDQPAAPPAYTLNLAGVVTYDLDPASPLVDAVPVGVGGCGTVSMDDMSLVGRPIDGDLDGVAACDIGARERPSTP